MFRENRKTLLLAAPIMAGQVGQMLMGWADTMMLGRVGVTQLAACAFSNSLTSVPLVCGIGLLSSVTVRASQAFGAGRASDAGEALRAGYVVALLAGLLVGALAHASIPLLDIFGQPDAVTKSAGPYLLLTAWSILPLYLTISARHFSEALSRPWAPFWIMIGGVLLNVLLNWLLIFGKGGFPALGLAGAGLATLLARIASALGLMAWVHRRRIYAPFLAAKNAHPVAAAGDLLRIGTPVALQFLGEVGAFAFGAVMIGWIGAKPLASHQIAITCAATTFMLPLGLSIAVSVRIGQASGAGETGRLRRIAFGALALASAGMACFAAIFFVGGGLIASWFVDDPAVIEIARRLLIVAAMFQIFDGCQVVSAGGLRGLADVRVPMATTFAGYWLLALPVAYVLAFKVDLGAVGVWLGLALGLAMAAVFLVLRLWRKTAE